MSQKQNQTIDAMFSNTALDIVVTNGAGGTVAAGDSLLIKQLLSDGTYRNSGVINKADVLSVNRTADVTAAGSTSVIDLDDVTKGTGQAHSLIVTIDEVGSKSFEDQDFKPAWVVEGAGETSYSLGKSLIENLASNLKNVHPQTNTKVTVTPTNGAAFEVWNNPLFTFTLTEGDTVGEDSVITITEKVPQKYSQGHIGYERIVFSTGYKVYDSVSSDDFVVVDVTNTTGAENPLDARRVQDLEWFAMGNYGDKYDGAGWPYNIKRTYYSKEDGTYTASFTIQKGLKGSGESYGTESQSTLQIFCQATADIATITAAINTAWGVDVTADATATVLL